MQITVVIPARNRAHTLKDCLESVLSQDDPAQEVLVVDDFSTDDTASVVSGFEARHVRLIRQPSPMGAQAARNRGILEASCDWIAFQDSDDRWHPSKLRLQRASLLDAPKPERTVVHCNANREIVSSGRIDPIEIGAFQGDCYASLLICPGPMFPGILVHKSSLLEIGLLDEHCPAYQEWDTSIRLAKSCSFIHNPQRLFDWRWHGGETISKDPERDFIGYHYVVTKHHSEIQRIHGLAAWHRVFAASLSRGLRLAQFDHVRRLAGFRAPYAANLVCGLISRIRVNPPGIPTAIRAAARFLP